jgi:hypothetical protein
MEATMFSAEELSDQLKAVRAELQTLPPLYERRRAEGEARVEQMMREAGVWEETQRIRADYERYRVEVQRHADRLSGKMQLLEQMVDKARAYVAPGTMAYGIDLSKLDSQTRLLVMSGNLQTIAALGGHLEHAARSEDSQGEVHEDPLA